MESKNIKHIYIASGTAEGGIYHYVLRNGSLNFCDKTDVNFPMYLTALDDKMYAVLRSPFEDDENSGVCSWKIDVNGGLHSRSEIQSTKGKIGCHLCADNNHIYATNYSSGNIICLPEGIVVEHGDDAHPHCIINTPDRKYLVVADLKLDKVIVYDKNLHKVSSATVPKGHGARHLCFSEDGKILYCVNELKSTVTVFSYNNGILVTKGTYGRIREAYSGETSAGAIRISEHQLYISHRGFDHIEVFEIKKDGTLGNSEFYSCGGEHPRDFNICDSILLSANMNSDTVTCLSCENGKLISTSEIIEIRKPMAILVLEQKEAKRNE